MRLKSRFHFFKYYFIKRMLAYIIDFSILSLLAKLLGFVIISSLFKVTNYKYYINLEYWDIAVKTQYIISYVSYFFMCFYLYRGQTIGLKVFKLQVKQIGFKKNQLTLHTALNRTMANYISHEFYFVPFIIAALNESNKTLPDFVSHSQVSYFNQFHHANELDINTIATIKESTNAKKSHAA